MATFNPPKINTAYTFYVSLVSQADTKTFQANPTLATGDVKVAIDDGAPANLATLPVVDADYTKRVKVALSSSEMNGDNITVIFSDASGAEWCDLTVNLQTVTNQFDDLATSTALATAQTDLDTLTGSDGVTLATSQPNYAPATAAALATVDGIVDSILVDTGTDIPASIAALNDLSSSDVQTAATASLNAYDPPTKNELDTAQTAITNAIGTLNDLSQAEVRSAIGLASANLDTQLGALPTAAENRAEMDSNSTQLAAIVADTAELQGDWANGGRLDLLIDAILEDTGTTIPALIAALNDLSAAEVNAQVLDVLNTDTFAEPSSVPDATATLAAKIGWLYLLARNRITQTATTGTVYADDGSTSVATSTVSDDNTTFVKGEWS